MATGDRNAPEGHEAGRAGGTNPRDTGSEDRKRRRKKRSIINEVPLEEEAPTGDNFGNQSGIGGIRDFVQERLFGARRARGASLINSGPSLAETTRRRLFGL